MIQIIRIFNFCLFILFSFNCNSQVNIIEQIRDSIFIDYSIHYKLKQYKSDNRRIVSVSFDTIDSKVIERIHDTCISFEIQPKIFNLNRHFKSLYKPLSFEGINELKRLYTDFVRQDSFIWSIVNNEACSHIPIRRAAFKIKNDILSLIAYQILAIYFNNDIDKMYNYLSWNLEKLEPNHFAIIFNNSDLEYKSIQHKLNNVFDNVEFKKYFIFIDLNSVFDIFVENIAEDIKKIEIVNNVESRCELDSSHHSVKFLSSIMIASINNKPNSKLTRVIFDRFSMFLKFPELSPWHIASHTGDSKFYYFIDSITLKGKDFDKLEEIIFYSSGNYGLTESKFIFDYLESKISQYNDNDSYYIIQYLKLMNYCYGEDLLDYYANYFDRTESKQIKNQICMNYISLVNNKYPEGKNLKFYEKACRYNGSNIK